MRGYKISVIRHGRTAANDQGVYVGQTDTPLSEKGRAELNNILDEYDYPRVAKVYSSPLCRCTETAEILFPEREIDVIPDLIEMNFGLFEGKTAEELVERADFKAWLTGDAQERPPEGESVQELQLRIFKGLRYMVEDMMSNDLTHCAAIMHSGMISILLAGFGLPKLSQKELHADPGRGFDIYITADLWQRSLAFEILGYCPYPKGQYELDTRF